MCTEVKKKVVTQAPRLEEKAKPELKFIKVDEEHSGCCDPNCGPSTCDR